MTTRGETATGRSLPPVGIELGHGKPGGSAKEAVVAIVQDMPDDSSYDDIVRELVFNRMVERGFADVDAGRTISDEETERSIESWRKG